MLYHYQTAVMVYDSTNVNKTNNLLTSNQWT